MSNAFSLVQYITGHIGARRSNAFHRSTVSGIVSDRVRRGDGFAAVVLVLFIRYVPTRSVPSLRTRSVPSLRKFFAVFMLVWWKLSHLGTLKSARPDFNPVRISAGWLSHIGLVRMVIRTSTCLARRGSYG